LGRLRSILIFSAGDPAPTAQLGRVLIHAQIAGPLSGQTGKHLLILSLSAFDPKADMRRVRWKGNVPQVPPEKDASQRAARNGPAASMRRCMIEALHFPRLAAIAASHLTG
jgi:hypothetical protein